MENTLKFLAFLFILRNVAFGQTYLSGPTGKSFTDDETQSTTIMRSGSANKSADNAVRTLWLPDGRIWSNKLMAT